MITIEQTSHISTITNFSGKDATIIYMMLLDYFELNKIEYIRTSNAVTISRYDFQELEEKLHSKYL